MHSATADSAFVHLSDAVLDQLLAVIFRGVPSSRVVFLSLLGRRLHASAVRVLYSSLDLEDNDALFSTFTRSPLYPILSRPEMYSNSISKLRILGSGSLVARSAETKCSTSTPITAQHLELLLSVCQNLEIIQWESSICPPDGFCEMLATCNSRLTVFSYKPHVSTVSERQHLRKWDALSLPLLQTLPLTKLHLSSLSQTGSRALCHLLQSYEQGSSIEQLSLDIVWLDDSLCEAIAENAWRLRTLTLSTSGTKLTDKGLLAILAGCDALESLSLDEVQGRLSRSLWSKADTFPQSLKIFAVTVSEAGHSWATDHLLSLDNLPLGGLDTFSVTRRESHLPLWGELLSTEPSTDDSVSLRPLPEQVHTLFMAKNSLTTLRCDFWMCSISDLKTILESCAKLNYMQISLDAPFSKLFAVASSFSNLLELHTLRVSINSKHAPGQPPSPLPPQAHRLPTPTSSPLITSKMLPSDLDANQSFSPMLEGSDPSMPPIRDVKRFMRRCAKLELLEWFGKHARGSWKAHRLPKAGINVSIEYQPPTIEHDAWVALRGQDSRETGWLDADLERSGHTWAGQTAEDLGALYSAQLVERHARRTSKQSAKPAKAGLVSPAQILDFPAESVSDNSFASPPTPVSPLSPTRSDTSYERDASVHHTGQLPSSLSTKHPSCFGRRGPGRRRSATINNREHEGEKDSVGNWTGHAKQGRRTSSMSTPTKPHANGKPRDRERKRV